MLALAGDRGGEDMDSRPEFSLTNDKADIPCAFTRSTYHTRVQEGIDISLKKLGLDYVDLYLVRSSMQTSALCMLP